jgi:hypothetical protein
MIRLPFLHNNIYPMSPPGSGTQDMYIYSAYFKNSNQEDKHLNDRLFT